MLTWTMPVNRLNVSAYVRVTMCVVCEAQAVVYHSQNIRMLDMMLENTKSNGLYLLYVSVVCNTTESCAEESVDCDHIKTCLTETFDIRRRTYLTPVDGRGETTVNRMFSDFPAFKKFEFVSTPVFFLA